MVRSGDWILPLRNGEDVPHKPPLMHWIGALAGKLRGGRVDEWTVRIPSAVASLLALFLLFDLVRRERGQEHGLLTALVLLTCESFTRQAREAWVDATLSTCVLGAVYFFRQMERTGKWRGWMSYALSLSVGLAVLSKGPVGALLPALAIGTYLLATAGRAGIAKVLHPAAVALAALVPLSWYGAAWVRGGEVFLTTHLVRENILHFFRGQEGARPFYFFFPALLAEAAPWSLVFPLAAWRAWKQRRRPALEALSLWWWLTAFVFFSLAAGKRRVYLLPTMPAVAIMVESWLADLEGWAPLAEKTRARLGVSFSLLLLSLMAWLWGALAGWWPGAGLLKLLGEPAWTSFFQTLSDAILRHPHLLGAGALGLGVGAGLVAWTLGSGKPQLAIWSLLGFLCFYTALPKPVNRESYKWQRALKTFAWQTRAIVGGGPLDYFRTGEIPQAFFYLDRHVPAAPCQYDPRALAGCPPGYYFLDTALWERLAAEQRGRASVILRSAGLDGVVKREDLVLVKVPTPAGPPQEPSTLPSPTD